MRYLILAATVATLLPCSISLASELMMVEVVVDGAPLRAGPDAEQYVTQHVTRGQRLDVYRKDGTEWLGVRPPKNSFSWVQRGDLESSSEPDLARARRAAVAYVGSEDRENKQLVSQVELREREVVVLLGPPESIEMPAGERGMWVRIAPPSGEFRWIHQRYVRPLPNDESTTDSAPMLAEGDRSHEVLDPNVLPAKSDGASDGAGDETVRVPGMSTSESKHVSSPSYADRLRELNLAFSTTVAKPVGQWRLAPLIREAEQLEKTGSNGAEQAEARILLDSLREFDDLYQRRKLSRSPAAESGRVDELEEPRRLADRDLERPRGDVSDDNRRGAIGSGVRPAASTPGDHDTQNAGLVLDLDGDFSDYDGSGWLLPVHSKRRSAPPFALMDDKGNVLAYVSPAPGLNLHRYVRKEVGIVGQRGYLPTLRGKHLTAERVIELERHRR